MVPNKLDEVIERRLTRPRREPPNGLGICDRLLFHDGRDGAGGVLGADGRDVLGCLSPDAGDDPEGLLLVRHPHIAEPS